MAIKLSWYGEEVKADVNNAVVEALVKSTDLVQSKATVLVPVDTGALRSSISNSVDTNSLEGIVYTSMAYASYVEFGLRSNPNYRSQPFLRPALYDNQAAISGYFKAEIKAVI